VRGFLARASAKLARILLMIKVIHELIGNTVFRWIQLKKLCIHACCFWQISIV